MHKALLLSIFLLSIGAAYAETPPAPPAAKPLDNLKKEEKDLSQKKEKLEGEAEKQEKEIASLQKKATSLADNIRKQEKELENLSVKVATLQKTKNDLETSLYDKRGQLTALTGVFYQLRMNPPEIYLLNPQAMKDNTVKYAALHSVMPVIQNEAETTRRQIAELQQVELAMAQAIKEAKDRQNTLGKDQKELGKIVDERQQSLKSTKKSLGQYSEKLSAIAREAKNLEDLIAKIDAENRKKQAQAASSKVKKAVLSGPAPKNLRLPVSGQITTGFGQQDSIGAKSEGIRIRAAAGALVTAPLKGTVKYTGNFRSYGKIILIEHAGGYHSLVAGLGKIDTVAGQQVTAGEPVGTLGTGQDGSPPSLYYELRQQGEPVNPAKLL
ncbi:MAG: peptidoglycan DD-metalloendopeptidase family protein [Alphaproteobacteria bacterium]|nr:peptidoglycan DD-metalloendopeptidase family protein [Alphaproteobacteria bacterium]